MRKTKLNYVPGYISIGLLCLLFIALLLPYTDSESYATDCVPGEPSCTTTLAESNIDLMIASTVSVALQSQVNLEVTPKSSGAFTEATSKLTIATNNPSGYAIYMQAGSNQDSKANLVSSDLGNTAVISPVEGMVNRNNFQNNTWGYSLDKTNYQAVPAMVSRIKETTTTTFKDTYDLFFGASVDTNLPAGQYVNSVIISAVANPIKITSLNQLTYMQDMTSEICANTAEDVTKQLIDTRDGKSYWVAKLRDGNCWMTQNLALDLSTTKTLTAADTDVSGDWIPTSNTNAVSFNGTLVDVSFKNAFSWNMGEIVLATPLLGKRCARVPQSDGSAYSNENLAEVCRESGFVDVSSNEWSPTYIAQAGRFNGEEQPLVAADEINHTYDAHYLIGNYYSWSAATAQTGLSITENNQVAPGSICPKGWRLPTSGKDENNQPIINPYLKTGSFYQLLRAYGYPETGGYEINIDNNRPFVASESVNALMKSPFYLVNTGNVFANAFGNLRNAGAVVYLWSNTSSVSFSPIRTFALSINNNNNEKSNIAYPVTDVDATNAVPIRCLAL